MSKVFQKLRIGTLFSGIGAFEQALLQMRIPHEIVFACDNGERYIKGKNGRILERDDIVSLFPGITGEALEKKVDELYEQTGKPNNVKKSYFANYDISEDRWHNDVRFMNGMRYRDKIDILVGGSPCQSFSTYGLKKGLEDARGTLFYDYARMIQEVQPKVFIFENVRGLLVHDKGNTWSIIKGVFESLNYDIGTPQILNAQDYGLPQMRKRLFVVGIKKSLGLSPFKYPEKIPLVDKASDSKYERAAKDVPIEYYLPEKGYKWVTEVERSQNKARLNRDIIGCQTAVQQYNWSGDFRLEEAKPEHKKPNSGVFVTRYNGPIEKLRNQFAGKDVVVRKLMPEECFRLMGFTNFKVHPDLRGQDQVLYRQAGNSIAVPVLKAILKELNKQVFERD